MTEDDTMCGSCPQRIMKHIYDVLDQDIAVKVQVTWVQFLWVRMQGSKWLAWSCFDKGFYMFSVVSMPLWIYESISENFRTSTLFVLSLFLVCIASPSLQYMFIPLSCTEFLKTCIQSTCEKILILKFVPNSITPPGIKPRSTVHWAVFKASQKKCPLSDFLLRRKWNSNNNKWN